MASFNSIFKNKKVFMTGHTGFKGSWMCVWLSMLGAKVKGYALKPGKPSLYNQIGNHLLNHESVIADIRNKKKLKKEILSFNPDFIFHLAAQPLVLKSYKNPLETYEVNAMGTIHILEVLKGLKKKCVTVIITTDKVYKNFERNYAYKEEDALGGYDPYSASKAVAEVITESYRLSYFNPGRYPVHKKSIATARAGNVIGGGDYAANRILPDIFRALSKNKRIEIRNPRSIRPWQHVLEPLHGYLSLAAEMATHPQEFAASFNFGPPLSDTLTVEELVKHSIKKWNKGKYKIVENKNAPHEAGLLQLDISKAKKQLNWQPKWNSKKAIDKTIFWYKKSIEKNCEVIKLCERDIENYLSE